MLDRSFFFPSPFPFSQLLSLECGYPEGYEPPQMSPKSIMCQQDPVLAKIEAEMAEREDQVGKRKKKKKMPLDYQSSFLYNSAYKSTCSFQLHNSYLILFSSHPCCSYFNSLFFYTSLLFSPYSRQGNHYKRLRNGKMSVPFYCT